MIESSIRLAVVLPLLALAACGNPEPTDQTPAASATNAGEPSGDPAARAEHDLASAAAPATGDRAPATVQEIAEPMATKREAAFDATNSSFSVDGETVALANGISIVAAAPGSASSVTTRYLGPEARGDLNWDGREDIAYFVVRDGAGSGEFHYVVVAITGKNGHKTTNAFLVGDRIKPQSLRIISNELHVNFVGRKSGEPMMSPPSVDSVLLLKVTPQGVLEGLMK